MSTAFQQQSTVVTAADWVKGISLSVLASVIGGASKLAIRKSWLLEERLQSQSRPSQIPGNDDNDEEYDSDNDDRPDRRTSIGDYNHQIVVQVMPPSSSPESKSPSSMPSPGIGGSSPLWSSQQPAPTVGDAPSPTYHPQASEELLVEFVARKQQRSPPSGGSSSLRQRLSLSISRDSSLGDASAASLTMDDGGDAAITTTNTADRSGGFGPTSPSSTASSPHAHRRATYTARSSSSRKQLLAYGLRTCGMVGMTILNPLCGILAMNYASPSILAPFSGLTLVWIVVLAGPLLHEPPSITQIRAASMILLGEVVVAVYGDHTTDQGLTTSNVLESYADPLFVLYLVAVTLWMAQLACWMRQHTHPTLQRFAWGVSGGSITGLQNFLKDALTLLKASKRTTSSSTTTSIIVVVVFGALAILTAFAGLALLTACMKRYDATYSAAMFVGSFVVSASLMSVVHYDTLAHLQSWTNLILYPTGLFVLLGGVYVLVQETSSNPESRNDDSSSPSSSSERPPLRSTPNDPSSSSALSLSSSSSSRRGHRSVVILDSERLVPDSDHPSGVLA